MIYDIYKLHPSFHYDGVYKGKKQPELIYSLNTGKMSYCDYMNKNWYTTLVWQEDIQNKLELNITYYVVAKDYSDFGTLVLYKGHSFFDIAEHDERVIIAIELGLTEKQAKIISRDF